MPRPPLEAGSNGSSKAGRTAEKVEGPQKLERARDSRGPGRPLPQGPSVWMEGGEEGGRRGRGVSR